MRLRITPQGGRAFRAYVQALRSLLDEPPALADEGDAGDSGTGAGCAAGAAGAAAEPAAQRPS